MKSTDRAIDIGDNEKKKKNNQTLALFRTRTMFQKLELLKVLFAHAD